MAREPKRPIIGLAQNPKGVLFQCGTCEYFDRGICHNPDPKLHRKPVESHWCCDLYEHPKMRVIIP